MAYLWFLRFLFLLRVKTLAIVVTSEGKLEFGKFNLVERPEQQTFIDLLPQTHSVGVPIPNHFIDIDERGKIEREREGEGFNAEFGFSSSDYQLCSNEFSGSYYIIQICRMA